MKNKWFLTLLLIIFVFSVSLTLIPNTYADTAMSINNKSDIVAGFTFDSTVEEGLVYCNPRGNRKQFLSDAMADSDSWVSKFGSITFNQFGQGFPYAGINEKGFCIIRILDESLNTNPEASIQSLQWIQFYLDHCSSVKQMIAEGIVPPSFEWFGSTHYFVIDSKNETAVIEFSNNETTIYSNLENTLPYSVLTETPYLEASESMDAISSVNKENRSALGRFQKTSILVDEWKNNSDGSLYLKAFDILLNAASGNTKWNVLFHISEKKVYFRTFAHDRVKIISLDDLNFSCDDPVKFWDINTTDNGNITDKFSHKHNNPEQSWEAINLFRISTSLKTTLSTSKMQMITVAPYSYDCDMEAAKTDSQRSQKYALVWLLITGLLAGLLFIAKGYQRHKEVVKNKKLLPKKEQPKNLYKKIKKNKKNG
ncbi:MAG: linear amide C-N hydrolase [Caldisericia bacterium]|nr:linear amide C-N hydrolase [Caldisericia bacterium]